MRNLKKILALVMALVMSLSLVTIANAADFTDNDDISYEEAADVMSTIGVIEGFEDGSFDPDGTLTREQAAKLVTYMLLGDNAERLGIERSTFKDVAMTRWSAPAIEYCVSLGIIDGAGDGNFYPAGQLTGAAFAKVLLTAIGYDSQKEQLVGSAWSVNVSALAADVGLDNGIEDLSWSAPITREEAAQMALNAICAPLVTYENDATITVNGAEVSIASSDAYYVTTTLAREQRINDRQLSNSDDYTVEFGEKYFPRLRLVRETDDFERPSHTWVYENTELGTYVDYDLLSEGGTYTEAVTGRDLYDLLGRSTIADYGLTYYVDGVVNNTITADNMIRGNTINYSTTGNGVLTQVFVDHDDEEIIITSINTYLAQANADYNESNETVSLKVFDTANGSGTTKIVDVADVANIVDLTEDQFVLVNMSGKNTASATNLEVVKVSDVEIMSDVAITKFSRSDTLVASKVTVDGEEYNASKKAFYDKDVLDEYDQQLLTDATYNVYLDDYGYAIGVDLFQGNLNYVFITGYDRGTSHISIKTATAAAIFLDGTMKEITVNVTNTNKNIERMDGIANNNTSGDLYFEEWSGAGEVGENRWYSYTETDGVYTLKPAARSFASDVNDGTVIKSDYVFMDDNGHILMNNGTQQYNNATGKNKGRAWGNDNSVYITVEAGVVDESAPGKTDAIVDVTGLYTGVQSVEIEITDELQQDVANNVYTLYDSDNYIIASIVLGEAQGSVQNYAYILGGAKSEELKSDGYYYWEFDAVVDGAKTTLQAKTEYSSTIMGLKPYHVQELRYDGEYVTDIENIPNTDIYADKRMPINGQDVYDVGHITNNNSLVHSDHATHTTNHACTQTTSSRISGTFTLQGRTLWTNERSMDVGLTFASENAPVVLVQKQGAVGVTPEVKVTNTSLNAVTGLLADPDPSTDGVQFNGRIVAVLNSQGVAQWAVVISDTTMVIGGGSIPSGYGYVPVTQTAWNTYVLRYYDNNTAGQNFLNQSEAETLLETYFGQNVEMITHSPVNGTGSFRLPSMPYMVMTYTQQEVVALKLDSTIVSYADAGVGAPGTTFNFPAVSNDYLISSLPAAGAATIDRGDTSYNTTTGAYDINMVTAYQVNHSFGTGNLKYTDNIGALQNLTSGDYVQKGNVLTAYTAAADSDYHQLVVNGNVTGESKKGDGINKTSFTYTVNGTINSMSISTGVQVIIGGHNYGVRQNGDKILFTAPVDGASYALEGNIGNGGIASTVMGSADGLTSAGVNYAYTVDTTDANAGVIELVQVAKVAQIGIALWYDTNGNGTVDKATDTMNANASNYVAVGSAVYAESHGTHTATYLIKVGPTGGTVAPVSGGTPADGTNPATARYQIKSTDADITFVFQAP